ncbi:Glyoxalase-like domain, group 6 [Dillenia turbinata]|uniref:Glyoxalase-like domain, group 6 n=1 Tax=Dillenia turbinata TaxID=194707 RepID=A0AAN8W2R7_9MAGN
MAQVQNGGSEKAGTFLAVKPQLIVEAPKAADAVQFYKAAFGAEEVNRCLHPKRKADQELPLILSAELKLGSSVILIADQVDDSLTSSKSGCGSCGCVMCLETEDVEAALKKAVAAGASAIGEIMEGEGPCGGGVVAKLKDPYGFVWLISSGSTKKLCTAVEPEA